MKTREMMTPEPACCVPSDNAVTAAMLMKSQNVGSIPVVDNRMDRKLIGIVTDRDLVVRIVAEQRDYYNSRIEDVMSRDLVTCRPNDDYDDVLDAMAKRQVRRVPVVDDQYRLVGIVAQADVARQSPKPEEVADVVEEISNPAVHGDAGRGKGIGKKSLLVAGGLGLGAGLLYMIDPRWARRAGADVAGAFK